jgi:hypothetical protein
MSDAGAEARAYVEGRRAAGWNDADICAEMLRAGWDARQAEALLRAPDDPEAQLKAYVEGARAAGRSDAEIGGELLTAGWSQQQVDALAGLSHEPEAVSPAAEPATESPAGPPSTSVTRSGGRTDTCPRCFGSVDVERHRAGGPSALSPVELALLGDVGAASIRLRCPRCGTTYELVE